MSKLDRRTGTLLAVAVAAGAVLRLADLGARDLWSDEVLTLRTMQLPFGDVLADRLHAGHVPLYFVLLRGWTDLFGASQFALRLPSALFGIALLLPAYHLFRRRLPGAAPVWGTALLAVHPVFVEMSREARMYSLLGLLFVVLAEATAAGLDHGKAPWRFWVAALLGPLVHPSWAFAVVPLGAWVLSERRGRAASDRRRANVLLYGLAGSVILLCALLVAAEPQHQTLTRRDWLAEAFVFVLRPYLSSRPADWFPTAGLAIVAWTAALIVGCRPSGRGRAFAKALVFGVPLASAAAGWIAGVPWGPARYVHLAALGAIAVAASAGEWLVADGPQPPVRRVVGVASRAFLAASLFLLAMMIVWRPDTVWSDAASRVRRDVPEGETLWVDDESVRLVLAHYAGRDVEAGRPPEGAQHWRATLEPDAVRPSVDVSFGEHPLPKPPGADDDDRRR